MSNPKLPFRNIGLENLKLTVRERLDEVSDIVEMTHAYKDHIFYARIWERKKMLQWVLSVVEKL